MRNNVVCTTQLPLTIFPADITGHEVTESINRTGYR
jgi:hypothetical protein